jgi:hypothetical protein
MYEWNSPVPWVFMIPIVAIVGGITVAIVSTIAKARVRELEIKERIAMIEKGLVPPPEVDPQRFDRAMDRIELLRAANARASYGTVASGRHRRAGVTLMGVGFGLMVLIAFAGDAPESAVGVGGFLVVMGLAFFINSLFEARQSIPPPREAAGAAPTPPPSTPH